MGALKNMLKYIGEYRELCTGHPEFPSIKDSFCRTSYEGQGKIIHYLRKGGNEDMVSMAINKDVFTGELLPTNIGRNDGEFSWWTCLAHYVEEYNLRLPEEFENKILNRRKPPVS